jgi:hypothetical protein
VDVIDVYLSRQSHDTEPHTYEVEEEEVHD